MDAADQSSSRSEQQYGAEVWALVERLVLLRTIDQLWVDHLTELDDFRRGVGLRGYGGTDPLNEFKREAFKLYEELRGFIRHQVAYDHLPRQRPEAGAPASTATDGSAVAASSWPRFGRRAARETAATARTATDPRRTKARHQVPEHAVAAAAGAAAPSGSGVASPGAMLPGLGAPRSGPVRLQHGDEQVGTAAGSGAPASAAKLGRNDPCWCGSGKKFKKCHGG